MAISSGFTRLMRQSPRVRGRKSLRRSPNRCRISLSRAAASSSPPATLRPYRGRTALISRRAARFAFGFGVAHQETCGRCRGGGAIAGQHAAVPARLDTALQVPVEQVGLQCRYEEIVEPTTARHLFAPQHPYRIDGVAVEPPEPLGTEVVWQTSLCDPANDGAATVFPAVDRLAHSHLEAIASQVAAPQPGLVPRELQHSHPFHPVQGLKGAVMLPGNTEPLPCDGALVLEASHSTSLYGSRRSLSRHQIVEVLSPRFST